ncbi:MAG: class I SAM-dependent methyltransferase [Thermoguttaceae bacterium]|nr:class I SAM-dependent methyltransferase [Thermoguttaceae bacterium]
MDLQERSRSYQGNIYFENPNNTWVIQYQFIPENAAVLDVGCANGELGKVLFQNKNCAVYGMDYNEFSLENARKSGAYRELHQVDLNVFSGSEFPHLHGLFDYIILGDVLEHLTEPDQVLEKLKKFLRPAGFFLISLPNLAHISIKLQLIHDEFNYTQTGLLDQTHIHFFTWKTLPKFFADLSMKIEKATATIEPLTEGEETCRFRKLPLGMRKLFFDDIHSWVFQYIMLVSVAGGKEELEMQNRGCLEFTKDSVAGEIWLFHTRKKRFLSIYFPKLMAFWERFMNKKR